MIGHTSKVVCEVLAATLLGFVLVLAAASWRLSQGPVSLTFLTDEIEEALNAGDGSLRVRLEGTHLAWAGWERTLDLRAVGVRLLGRDDRLVASVPEMAVSFSARALLRGVLAPTTLEFIGAHVELERRPDGAFSLAMGDRSGGVSDELLREIVATISEPPDIARPLSFLRRVSVVDSRVDIADRMTDTVWGAPDADIIITRGKEGLRMHFAAGLDLGGELTRVSGGLEWTMAANQVSAELRFSGVRPSHLAAKLPSLARLSALRAPVTGDVNLILAARSGMLREAEFRLNAGKGVIDLPELWPEGLPVEQLTVKGRFRSGPDMLDIESLEADLGGPKLSGQGSAIRIGRTTAFDGTAVLRDVPVKSVGRYWPVTASPPARAWILENVQGGMLREARARIAMHSDGIGSGGFGIDVLNGTMTVVDGTIAFLEGMPPLREANATGAFTRDRFLFTFTSGELEGLKLESGNARFTQLDTDSEQAAVEVVIRGRLSDALKVLDRPRFGFASDLGLKPEDVKGESATRLVVSFPLKKDLPEEQVKVAAAANLRGVSLPDAVMGHALSGGSMTLRVDRKGMEVKGKVRIGPVPADIVWFEDFAGDQPFSRRYEIKASLDETGRKAFDLPFADEVSGPVALDLALLERPDGTGQMAVKLGLKDAVLNVPALDWTKPKGKDALGWLSVDTRRREPVAIPEFSLTTPELRVEGAIDLPRDDGALTVRLSRFSLGATEISGRILRRADGAVEVTIGGRGLDAAALIRHVMEEGGGNGAMPPLTVDARLERLWFSTGEPVTDVTASFRYDGGALRALNFNGVIAEAHRIRINVGATEKGRSFVFHSDNAGRALGVIGLTQNVRGGTLSIRATKEEGKEDAPWRGQVNMNDWQLVKAPPLARMLTVLSLTGINNLLSGQGIAFAALEMPFVYDRAALKIENARAVGSELGITGSGTIDTQKETWNIEGTLVPAYTINSILGNIPFLGRLFTGDKGSGVFAATYKVEGTMDNPRVTVNPLAALAPGFLRNLLGIFSGGETPKKQTLPGATPD